MLSFVQSGGKSRGRQDVAVGAAAAAVIPAMKIKKHKLNKLTILPVGDRIPAGRIEVFYEGKILSD